MHFLLEAAFGSPSAPAHELHWLTAERLDLRWNPAVT